MVPGVHCDNRVDSLTLQAWEQHIVSYIEVIPYKMNLPFSQPMFMLMNKVSSVSCFSSKPEQQQSTSDVFSSPEHKVLMVSYCDRALSVVRRASCVNFFTQTSSPLKPLIGF